MRSGADDDDFAVAMPLKKTPPAASRIVGQRQSAYLLSIFFYFGGVGARYGTEVTTYRYLDVLAPSVIHPVDSPT